MAEVQDNPKLQQFHEALQKANYNVPDYATFETTMKDPAKSKVFYDALQKDKYELPDYDTFASDLGLKKKDASDYGLPSSEVFSQMFGNISKDNAVSERPPDPVDEKKLKTPDLSLKSPEFKGPQLTDLKSTVADYLSGRRLTSKEYKEQAEKRISELDQQIAKLPEDETQSMPAMNFSGGLILPSRPVSEEKARLLKEKDNLRMAVETPSKLDYILGKAYNQSIIGLSDAILNGERRAPEDWLKKYDASTLEDVTATTLGFLLDSPMFGLGGKIGSVIGEAAANPIVNRAIKKGVEKLIDAGIEEETAKKLALKGTERLTQGIIGGASSGTALGSYGFLTSALNDWAVPGAHFDDIKYGQAFKRGAKDFVLGTGIGMLGIASSAVAEKARGISQGAARAGAQVGIAAGGLTAESALFTYGGALLDGKNPKDVTAKDFLQMAGMLLMLKGSQAVQSPIKSLVNIYNSAKFNSGKPGEDDYAVDIEPWEANSLGYANYKELMDASAHSDRFLAKTLNDDNVPALLKQKLLWGARGLAMTDVNLYPERVVANNESVDYYNKDGVLVDRSKFTSKEEADQTAMRVGLQLEDNRKQMKAAGPTTDKVKVITELNDKGIDLKKVIESLDKPVADRTPEDSKVVSEFYKAVDKSQLSSEDQKNDEERNKPKGVRLVYDSSKKGNPPLDGADEDLANKMIEAEIAKAKSPEDVWGKMSQLHYDIRGRHQEDFTQFIQDRIDGKTNKTFKEWRDEGDVSPDENPVKEKPTEPTKTKSVFPEGFTPEVRIRKSGKVRIELTDDKTGKLVSSFTFHPVDVNGENYSAGGELFTDEDYRGRKLGQNVLRLALENLPKDSKGLYFKEETIHNHTEIPHIFDLLGKDYDVTTEKNGDVFIRPKTEPEEIKPEYWNKEDAPKGMKEQFASVKLKDGAEEALKNLPKKPIQTLGDGTKVYEVGGQYIRDNVHQEFTQGGNEGAYPSYVPKGEIWIDDVLGPKDREATILHESVEQRDMLDNGTTYKDAHEKANKAEEKFRETGEKPEIKPTDENKSEVQQPDNTKGTEGKTNLSGGTEADKGQPTPKGEEKSVAESADKGVDYNGKIYKTVDEVQDDLADKKLTFEESKPLMEKVRKFEEQEIKNRLANHLEDLADSIGAIKKFEGAERETVIKNLMNVLKDLADLTKLKGEQLLAKLKEYLKEHKKEIPDDVINEAFKRHNEKTPESKLIEDLKSVPTKKVSMKERMDGIKTAFDRLSEKMPEGEDKFWAKFGNKLDNLKENTKAVWKAYSGMPEWTDYKQALGDWSLAKQLNDRELMQFVKLIEKKIPSRARREAIVNYIEADGDKDVLKEREKTSRLNHKKGYTDAQNLTPDEVKIAKSIKDYFNDMLKMGFDSGILKSQIENYVTHFGVRPDDPAVTKIIGGFDNGKLNTTFKYAKGRVFDTFHDLENAGFRADKDFKDIIPAYSKAFHRTIFSRAFVKNLTEGKAKDGRPIVVNAGIGSMTGDENIAKAALVNPYSKPEEASDYKYINHPAFRDWYWATKTADGTNVFAKGELVIHPDYHLSLSNILGKSDLMKSIPLREVTKAVNVTKQTIFMLSPFFHYIQEGYHAIGHTVNPLFGLTKFDPHDMNHQKLIQGGLKLYDFQAKSNFAEGLASLNVASKIPIIKDTILPIQEYLFNEYIPKLKLTTAEHMVARNLKRYQGKYSVDQIYALSASQANAAYGNLNYELIGRNPTVQHIFRMAALAPDFLEARTRFVGQALTPKGAEQRRALLILGGTMFVASRIMNKLFDDDYHWEKPFSFIYNKNEYTLRSVPEDAWELINDPNRFIYNRMSPLFRSVVVEGLTKRDFRGIPESTEDWLKSIVTSPMPSQVTRMLPEGWGKNESDDKLWDDFINTIGLRERHYFTPVEKEIRNTYYERDPRGKLSENQKYKMKVRQEINKIATKDGNEPLSEEHVKQISDLINENVKNGKLTIYQGQDLLDNIGGEKKDVLVTMYNRLPEDDKEAIYNKMSDKEKEVYPVPKGMYSPYNLLKDKNKEVYDRLIEYGGVKTIHQDVKLSVFNKNVKLDKKASEEFNDDLIQKYGEQVKALIGTDKKRFDELKKTEMPVTKDNPEGNMLKESLDLAWERAHLQAEQTAKTKYINKK